MDKIIKLEQELKLNKIMILRIEKTDSKEYRGLLIQRSNIKDLLLEEYRKELLDRRADIEAVTEGVPV